MAIKITDNISGLTLKIDGAHADQYVSNISIIEDDKLIGSVRINRKQRERIVRELFNDNCKDRKKNGNT